ncbi:MAG: YciI-like protein [Balneolaceae bacterium]
MHYLLFYTTSPDYLERRNEFREEHLSLAWQSHEKGELILGGALSDPADGAVLLFESKSPETAVKFAEQDPYVKNGLVKSWKVRPWTTVVGDYSTTPIKPKNE